MLPAETRGQGNIHFQSISQWVESLDSGLAQYQEVLLATFDHLSQICDLYADNFEDFCDDVNVDNPQHRDTFINALAELCASGV